MSGDPTLSQEATRAITSARNEIFVSAASAWEISIKRAAGKLDAPSDLTEQLAAHRFMELPITHEHALMAGTLPPHHGDPFDRMLVAQARTEKLTLVSRDKWIEAYGVAYLQA